MAELFGRAYLYTDDRTYARGAAIILDRTADEYTVEVGDQFTIPHSGSWSRDRA